MHPSPSLPRLPGVAVALALCALVGWATAARGAESAPAGAAAGGPEEGHECLIEADQQVEVRLPVAGLVETVHHGRGDVVEAGAALVTLESSVERAAVEVARQRAAAAGAIEAGQARVELLGRKYERQRDLERDQAVSAQDRDDADLERRVAAAELRQARENRDLARGELAQATAELARRILRSPFRGVVVARNVDPGEYVEPSLGAEPAFELARLDPLRVEVILPVALYGSVRVGDPAVVFPEPPIGGRHATTVELVDAVVDARSGTFGVRLVLANPDHALPPGVRCRVRFGADPPGTAP